MQCGFGEEKECNAKCIYYKTCIRSEYKNKDKETSEGGKYDRAR